MIYIMLKIEMCLLTPPQNSHKLQLWFGPDFTKYRVIAFDANGKLYKFYNDFNNEDWDCDIKHFDVIRVHAWGDGEDFKIILEELEVDYIIAQ